MFLHEHAHHLLTRTETLRKGGGSTDLEIPHLHGGIGCNPPEAPYSQCHCEPVRTLVWQSPAATDEIATSLRSSQ